MPTAGSLVDEARETFPEVTATRMLDYANQIDREVLGAVPLRTDKTYIPLVDGTQEYPVSELLLRAASARIIYGPSRRATDLRQTSKNALDRDFPGWRDAEDSDAIDRAYFTNSLTQGMVGLYPKPSTSTLLISGATNASPIVISTTADHGLEDGDQATIVGVLGNTAANGDWTVTYISDTTFSLDDSTGSGAYIAGTGDFVASISSPLLEIDATERTELLTSTDMPLSPSISRLYVDGMCFLAARKLRLWEDARNYKALFEEALALQAQASVSRFEDVHPEIRPFKVRHGFRRGVAKG